MHTGTYTTTGNHFVIAYYLVYVPYWNSYGWYDPWSFGFNGVGGGNEVYYDYGGYWGYESYWVSSPQYVDTTSYTITYQGPPCGCQSGQQFTSCPPCPPSNPNECQPGQQFTPSGQPCPGFVPPVEPPQQPVVSVRFVDTALRPSGLTAKSAPNHLTSPKNTIVETCITGYSNPTGQSVNLELINESSILAQDGGHKEPFHSTSRNNALGTLGKRQGTTGADGCYRTRYTPPVISGIYSVKSTILGTSNKANVAVYIPNLHRLTPGTNYRLIGGANNVGQENCNAPDSSCSVGTIYDNSHQAHPNNHWGVFEAVVNLPLIADTYKTRYYGNGEISPFDMVTFNDMSLEWGGKFDLNRNWLDAKSHAEHRDGQMGIDTRSKNIPDDRHDTIMRIFNDVGFAWYDERYRDPTKPHWHLRWAYVKNGALLNEVASSPPLQNGIDQNAAVSSDWTPSTIASRIGESIFERSVTPDEFESWSPQLIYAKSQGLPMFLQEVKTFEKQLFASQEYVARQRTNEEFVQDVFESHLFREPTTQELSYWLVHLSDISGTQPIDPTDIESGRGRTTIPLNQQQRRQLFLNDFQELPAFVNTVGSVVDDTYQEPPH